MNVFREFDIHISKLAPGQHEYSYQINDSFFALFENSLVNEGKLRAEVSLEKKPTFIQLQFVIEGTIKLICDRSLDEFDYPLSCEYGLLLKFGDENKEISEEIEIIHHNTQQINVARYIFEFISLEIPMKKLHPRYEENDQNDGLIYTDDEPEENEDIDPRWSKLKDIKNKD